MDTGSHNRVINNATLSIMDNLVLEQNTPLEEENIGSQYIEGNKLESTYNYSVKSNLYLKNFAGKFPTLQFVMKNLVLCLLFDFSGPTNFLGL